MNCYVLQVLEDGHVTFLQEVSRKRQVDMLVKQTQRELHQKTTIPNVCYLDKVPQKFDIFKNRDPELWDALD